MVAKTQKISAVAVKDLYDEYKRLQKIEDDVKAQKEHIRAVFKEYAMEYDSSNKIEKGKFTFEMKGEKDLSVSWSKEKRFKKDLFLMEHSIEEYEKYSDANDNVTIKLRAVKHEPEFRL